MMQTAQNQLMKVFVELNQRVEALNQERLDDGLFAVPKAKAQILGQMSLLANEKVSVLLTLAQTGDLDALLTMDGLVKAELKKILLNQGLLYDEDSYLIWIPPKSTFNTLFDLEHILVQLIDAESALVSKAVKAPAKNRQLIREAIASEEFPGLVDRILENGGKLEDFL
jgi:hypothetical protein